MSMTVDATFRKGVFVPVNPVEIGEDARVRLIVEEVAPPAASSPPRLSRTHRIKLPPGMAEHIASAPELDLFES